jgi:hypothetical protein
MRGAGAGIEPARLTTVIAEFRFAVKGLQENCVKAVAVAILGHEAS